MLVVRTSRAGLAALGAAGLLGLAVAPLGWFNLPLALAACSAWMLVSVAIHAPFLVGVLLLTAGFFLFARLVLGLARTYMNAPETVAVCVWWPREEPRRMIPGLPTEARCPVCGDGFRCDDFACCPHCQTPHHEDCLRYLGSCGLLGCARPSAPPPASATDPGCPGRVGASP